jgi:hypothetical protein
MDPDQLATLHAELSALRQQVGEMYDLLQEYKPLLARYKTMAVASNFRDIRKVMKGK